MRRGSPGECIEPECQARLAAGGVVGVDSPDLRGPVECAHGVGESGGRNGLVRARRRLEGVGNVRLRRTLARLIDGPPALCLADPLDR